MHSRYSSPQCLNLPHFYPSFHYFGTSLYVYNSFSDFIRPSFLDSEMARHLIFALLLLTLALFNDAKAASIEDPSSANITTGLDESIEPLSANITTGGDEAPVDLPIGNITTGKGKGGRKRKSGSVEEALEDPESGNLTSTVNDIATASKALMFDLEFLSAILN